MGAVLIAVTIVTMVSAEAMVPIVTIVNQQSLKSWDSAGRKS